MTQGLRIVFPTVASSSGHERLYSVAFVINALRGREGDIFPFVRAKIRLSFHIEMLNVAASVHPR